VLVRLELDEFEWPGADRVLPHLGRGHMTRVYGRIAGSEQREERRLRPPQVKSRLLIILGCHVFQVAVPLLARVAAEFLLPFAEQQVPSAFDVLGGERLAIMPFDALPQFERQFLAVLAP